MALYLINLRIVVASPSDVKKERETVDRVAARPDTQAEGIKAIQRTWGAALFGVSLQIYASGHPELRHSIEEFGKATGFLARPSAPEPAEAD
jgi:hypothetical protein